MKYCLQKYLSPVGTLMLAASDESLCGIIYPAMWPYFSKQFTDVQEASNSVIEATKVQLDEYFAAQRQTFQLPISLNGTAFQKAAWQALERIQYGETKTYKEQAVYIQSPKAARAVGRTDGLNPISIVLPCHRVVGSNGALTGYAGGIAQKKWLLDFEAEHRYSAG